MMSRFIFLIAFTTLICINFNNALAQNQIGGDIDGEAAFDGSGGSVSMPNTYTLAIGAGGNDGTFTESGHVRIYTRRGNNWVQKGSDIDGEAAQDGSGASVSMPNSNTVAIGAYLNDGNGTSSGHVRIFNWNGATWVQKGADIDGEATLDQSGFSISMSDANTLAIGAPGNAGNGGGSGHTRVYRWSGSTWIQKGMDIDGEAPFDGSGRSVSMPDSNTVAIGAHLNDGNGSVSGHVRIYQWNGSAWSQKGADIDGETANDQSGQSVSMPDSNTVAIGAPSNSGNGTRSGHVRIYRWNGSIWSQKGMDIDGEAAFDQSGHSVSMPDSNTVAIGASRNDATSFGSNMGHVRIYRWNNGTWIQRGIDIDGEAFGDGSGGSISMPDSNTIAIGASVNDGNGTSSGHVRIYALCRIDSTVNVTACDDYTWEANQQTYDTSGTYTVTLTSSTGCDSVITLNLTVDTINPAVTKNGFVLTANQVAANYQWINCDSNITIPGAINRSFTVTKNGSYGVIVTTNNCSDTSQCEIYLNIGAQEILQRPTSFVLEPNPANGWFTFETRRISSNSTVFIYNHTGLLIKEIVLKTNQQRFDVSELSNGLYLVRYGNEVKKLVVKR